MPQAPCSRGLRGSPPQIDFFKHWVKYSTNFFYTKKCKGKAPRSGGGSAGVSPANQFFQYIHTKFLSVSVTGFGHNLNNYWQIECYSQSWKLGFSELPITGGNPTGHITIRDWFRVYVYSFHHGYFLPAVIDSNTLTQVMYFHYNGWLRD